MADIMSFGYCQKNVALSVSCRDFAIPNLYFNWLPEGRSGRHASAGRKQRRLTPSGVLPSNFARCERGGNQLLAGEGHVLDHAVHDIADEVAFICAAGRHRHFDNLQFDVQRRPRDLATLVGQKQPQYPFVVIVRPALDQIPFLDLRNQHADIGTADQQFSCKILLRYALVAVDIRQNVEMGNLDVQGSQFPRQPLIDHLAGAGDGNPVPESRIVPGQSLIFVHSCTI